MKFSWPWVSRVEYDRMQKGLIDKVLDAEDLTYKLRAELKLEQQRARRRERRNGSTAGPDGTRWAPIGGTPSVIPGGITVALGEGDRSAIEGTVSVAPSPDELSIAKAIRQVAGNDRPLARHLRTFADEQVALEVPTPRIVRAILKGQEVPL